MYYPVINRLVQYTRSYMHRLGCVHVTRYCITCYYFEYISLVMYIHKPMKLLLHISKGLYISIFYVEPSDLLALFRYST